MSTPLQTDTAILNWIERHSTIHKTVEFLWTGGQMEVSLVDDRINQVTYRSAPSLREAMSMLMEAHE